MIVAGFLDTDPLLPVTRLAASAELRATFSVSLEVSSL